MDDLKLVKKQVITRVLYETQVSQGSQRSSFTFGNDTPIT